ncbi:Holliday junction branch migration protein RuvA [Wolbachia endosymbiont of Howardula sp.]|uniref:Holliday junction branch migration protein RuvA n=1 Tax=Wolbachia endosymbiont of Howardula sp. TaxID=2916816 RepID=UPI00217D6D99|nr:Holliday junction branch migration protein RuvA [Wolbachia endosymbiont of Howardula sp.]UWI83318.1 Holliday junction branch migration protein RuvA [Wolbachia endosymbiont of Howardula sp.]
MIDNLKGIVEAVYNNHIILNVHDIGYIIHFSEKTLKKCETGTSLTCLIEVYINNRDHMTQLYGFISQEERQCLRLLVTVNGVSYKTAMSILSTLTPNQLFTAISIDNKAALKIHGLGTKLINRIMIDLRDKIYKLKIQYPFCSAVHEDAVSALINLGYDKTQAFHIIAQYDSHLDTKEMIRMALKELSILCN